MASQFAIHNTVRGRTNRTQRAASAVHHRLVQRLGPSQARVRRGRPVILTEDAFLAQLDEIKQKVALGVIEVRSLDGRLVDLDTLEPAVPVVIPRRPEPVMDSAANDKPAGEKMGMYPGGKDPMTAEESEVNIPLDFLPEDEADVEVEGDAEDA